MMTALLIVVSLLGVETMVLSLLRFSHAARIPCVLCVMPLMVAFGIMFVHAVGLGVFCLAVTGLLAVMFRADMSTVDKSESVGDDGKEDRE